MQVIDWNNKDNNLLRPNWDHTEIWIFGGEHILLKLLNKNVPNLLHKFFSFWISTLHCGKNRKYWKPKKSSPKHSHWTSRWFPQEEWLKTCFYSVLSQTPWLRADYYMFFLKEWDYFSCLLLFRLLVMFWTCPLIPKYIFLAAKVFQWRNNRQYFVLWFMHRIHKHPFPLSITLYLFYCHTWCFNRRGPKLKMVIMEKKT